MCVKDSCPTCTSLGPKAIRGFQNCIQLKTVVMNKLMGNPSSEDRQRCLKSLFSKSPSQSWLFCICVRMCRWARFCATFYGLMKERGGTQQQVANGSGTATQSRKEILDSPDGAMATTYWNCPVLIEMPVRTQCPKGIFLQRHFEGFVPFVALKYCPSDVSLSWHTDGAHLREISHLCFRFFRIEYILWGMLGLNRSYMNSKLFLGWVCLS